MKKVLAVLLCVIASQVAFLLLAYGMIFFFGSCRGAFEASRPPVSALPIPRAHVTEENVASKHEQGYQYQGFKGHARGTSKKWAKDPSRKSVKRFRSMTQR